MNQTVQGAVDQVRGAFPESKIEVQEDGQGGAWVVVDNVAIGETYTTPSTWIGFRVTFQYPNADVYPHFIRSDLLRKDGRPLGDGISGGHTFLGRPALQLSRRSKRLNPATDTALLKLMKVVQWLAVHP
jgi:hypothetical protein